MMISHKVIVGMVACVMLCARNDALGVFAESSVDSTPAAWNVLLLGFDSDVNDFPGRDISNLLGATETSIDIDLLAEGENHNGWSVSAAALQSGLGKDKAATIFDAMTHGNGNAAETSWDAAAWIDRVLDAGLTNSNMDFTWYLGAWVDDGMNTGLSNEYSGNIESIPEPATYGLITIFGGGLLLFRRRFKT